ncbi:MAG TPA: host attachment protein [Gammaproteobacteria bacterium]|nr:host attachment protein [Gammaproteobacteria bacterium]
MNTNWILVAHRSGARVFSSAGAHSALTLVEDIDFEQGRLRPREIEADRPGRSHDRFGEQRHGVGTEQSPTEHLAVEFAQSLAAMLKTAHEEKKFDRLVLVAGPKFLGHLREALDKQTAAAVKATLDKDLGEIPPQELPSHLQAVL